MAHGYGLKPEKTTRPTSQTHELFISAGHISSEMEKTSEPAWIEEFQVHGSRGGGEKLGLWKRKSHVGTVPTNRKVC